MKHPGLLIGLALLLYGCASPAPVLRAHLPRDLPDPGIELEGTPFFPQTAHHCGPAALAMSIGATGVEVTPEALTPQVYLPAREGSLQAEMVAAVRRYGRVPFVISPHVASLLAELRAGYPVLVLQNLGTGSFPAWHYAVVVGYLPDSDRFILRSGTTRRDLVRADRFLRTWVLAGSWGLVVLPPGELPADGHPDRYLAAVADLETTGQAKAAELAYAAATERWPDNPTAWLGLGNAEYRSGDFGQAGRSYREAIRVEPGYTAAYNNLAEAQARSGCFEAALATLGEALQHSGDAAQRLRVNLLDTRREILSRRPDEYQGDSPSCLQSAGKERLGDTTRR